MKILPIRQGALQKSKKLSQDMLELELIKERARQSFNNSNIAGYRIPAPKNEFAEALELQVKRELLWEDVIKRMAGKFIWTGLK